MMTTIPLVSNFQGDFVLQLVPVDDDVTMDDLAAACAYHSVNRRVKPHPGKVMRVRLQDSPLPIAREMTVKNSGLKPMDTVEIYFED